MAITDLDEQLLVRAHQAGDEHAFGQIVRSQHRTLYAHAYRRLGDHEAAEDAVQDTLLRAYRALPSFDGDLRLRAWLHRILTNVCHDEGNRRRREAGLIDKLEAQPIEPAPDPIEEAVLHDTVRLMNEALAELPESYREALVLRYVDGLSFREVAEVTGISEENARARVHRGRQALSKVLSRLAILVAFVVPGLRRTQKGLDPSAVDAVNASSAEPAMSLTTQLASHVVQAAPVINRVAAEGSTMLAAKSSVVATAVAAMAAVSAPVVAYKVYDTATAPERPPAAVASPAIDDDVAPSTTVPPVVTDAAGGDDAVVGVDSSTTSTTTATELPPSAVRPFAPGNVDEVPKGSKQNDTSTTTTSTTSPASPAVDTVDATLGGSGFEVTGERPDFDITGVVQLSDGTHTVSGVLAGSLYVADTIGDVVKTELVLTLDDGREFRVRFRGTLDAEETAERSTRWTAAGRYSIPGGSELEVAETGGASLVFELVDGGASSLAFDLRGDAAQQ